MGKIDYKSIYEKNQDGWKELTRDPQKYEALLAGHYSDSNHFVYELLQNAEDAFDNQKGIYPSKVVIEYYPDRLVFYHNGKPFDEDDVRGVSSMLMGTKNRNDAQTIGHFGMGFKSVFKYTSEPEIYSDEEAFKITKYLLPEEITDGWNYAAEKEKIVCKLGNDEDFRPYLNDDHLTKIVIPFKKYGKGEDFVSVSGDDVLEKLEELNGEILLFLTHIQDLYWTNKETGEFAYIKLDKDENDEKKIKCSIKGTKYGFSENISRYLKFKKSFECSDPNNSEIKHNAEVSVAYKLNTGGYNIIAAEQSYISVYFPTKDKTELPFLIHGSFETAVSRESLMYPSHFNECLFKELGNLIAESMTDLAGRKFIKQSFLRNIILEAFNDEKNWWKKCIPDLKRKVTEVIRENGLIPDRDGNYRKPEELLIPVPFSIGDFIGKPLIGKVLDKALDNKVFVAFNDEKGTNFQKYYFWLRMNLGIEIFDLLEFADNLSMHIKKNDPVSDDEFATLNEFYNFLSNNTTGKIHFISSNSYVDSDETVDPDVLKAAWDSLREAPIILNRLNKLVPAMENGQPAIYLGSSSDYETVDPSELVNESISNSFHSLLTDGFHIPEFDNYQYVKEKLIKKYSGNNGVVFRDPDNFKVEYVNDLKVILALIKEKGGNYDVGYLLWNTKIIKVKPKNTSDVFIFERPQKCYIPVSAEGINLEIYFGNLPFKNTGDLYANLSAIDTEFYAENDIAINDLVKLGLVTTPVDEGGKEKKEGNRKCEAIGEYRPRLYIKAIYENLQYIDQHRDLNTAKEKSVEILKLLLPLSKKLEGEIVKGKGYNAERVHEEVPCLKTIKSSKWLFDNNMQLHSPIELSRHDLNKDLYGSLSANKEAYKALGFVEKEADIAEETFQKVANLNRQDKEFLFKLLGDQLGFRIPDVSSSDYQNYGDDDEYFDPNARKYEEFPKRNVTDFSRLNKHVLEQFYYAVPIKYDKVVRQIRVSKDVEADRAYAINMYTNSDFATICQICKKPIKHIAVRQIANFGIEMSQLNLCLCKDCAEEYSKLGNGNKGEEFKRTIRDKLLNIDVEADLENYSIELNKDMNIYFTQKHAAELKEILRLLDECESRKKYDVHEEREDSQLFSDKNKKKLLKKLGNKKSRR